MRHQIINVGLIGLGRIGKMHAENICYKLPFLNARNTITAGPEPRTKIIDNICPKTCQFIIKTVSI